MYSSELYRATKAIAYETDGDMGWQTAAINTH